jgi:hypothetical protein
MHRYTSGLYEPIQAQNTSLNRWEWLTNPTSQLLRNTGVLAVRPTKHTLTFEPVESAIEDNLLR